MKPISSKKLSLPYPHPRQLRQSSTSLFTRQVPEKGDLSNTACSLTDATYSHALESAVLKHPTQGLMRPKSTMSIASTDQLEQLLVDYNNAVSVDKNTRFDHFLDQKGYSKTLHHLTFSNEAMKALYPLQFHGMRFISYDFSENSVDRAQFTECRWKKCRFSKAAFTHAKLRHCTFESSPLDGVFFVASDLDQVAFKRCRITDSSFEDAQLDRVHFHDCVLSATHFLNSRVRRSTIEKSQVADTEFFLVQTILFLMQRRVKHLK